MTRERSEKNWQVYLLECRDKSLYCGVTNNLEDRIAAHNLGKASRYTRSRRPVTCVAKSPLMEKSQAFALEYRVKKRPKQEKRRWVETGACPDK